MNCPQGELSAFSAFNRGHRRSARFLVNRLASLSEC
jgi:hypothetical protein